MRPVKEVGVTHTDRQVGRGEAREGGGGDSWTGCPTCSPLTAARGSSGSTATEAGRQTGGQGGGRSSTMTNITPDSPPQAGQVA